MLALITHDACRRHDNGFGHPESPARIDAVERRLERDLVGRGQAVWIEAPAATDEDVLLVHTADGAPLPPEHGGPIRMITPQLYAWKGAKWINRVEFLAANSKVDRAPRAPAP